MLHQSDSSGVGEKWLNSGYILKGELTGFADSWMRGLKEWVELKVLDIEKTMGRVDFGKTNNYFYIKLNISHSSRDAD